MRPTPNPDWVAEETLATELAVPRPVLQAHRDTLSPEDCEREGAFICWKKTAAAAFAASLGLTWPPVAAVEKTAPQIETVSVASVPRATGWHFPNRRIIRARRDNGEQVDVVVQDSSKYTTHLRTGEPMRFQAQRSPNGAHWVLVGREPRWKGAW